MITEHPSPWLVDLRKRLIDTFSDLKDLKLELHITSTHVGIAVSWRQAGGTRVYIDQIENKELIYLNDHVEKLVKYVKNTHDQLT